MAKIKLIKMNFVTKTKEILSKGGILGEALFGDAIKEALGNLPDEQEIWVDTDEIRQIDTLIVKGAFKIHYKGESTDGKNAVDIKAECLNELLEAWK